MPLEIRPEKPRIESCSLILEPMLIFRAERGLLNPIVKLVSAQETVMSCKANVGMSFA
jgi:hypothetical protein